MEENKNKKSRAVLITIIILIIFFVIGYLLFANRDIFGVKTSNSIAKIFSPLTSSNNPKDLSTVNSTCSNNATNPPTCTTLNGACINGNTNPPECTAPAVCTNNTDNPPLCTTLNGLCINRNNNPPECTGKGPDLTVSTIAPTITTINITTMLSSTISNIGGESTGHNFSAFFTIATTKNTEAQVNTNNHKNIELVATVPQIEAKAGSIATVSYNFKSTGIYYIRACADKNSPSDNGTITELNENNNCGPWTTITVSNSLPTTGKTNYTTTNNLSGLEPQCNDGVDNDGDKKVDIKDPDCHLNGDITKEYLPEYNSESNPQLSPYTNACLDIEKNPLTFTDAEQSQLDELLRKFYLIAPTLKTTDDVSLTYSDITQQQNFIDQLNTLTKQCYAQKSSPSYTGPTASFGNPWYRYDIRGSYLDSSYNKPSYCTKAPGGWPHKSFNCSAFTDKYSCQQYEYTPFLGTRQILDTGCVWIESLNLKEYETLLNVW